jgi:hypothetical protein
LTVARKERPAGDDGEVAHLGSALPALAAAGDLNQLSRVLDDQDHGEFPTPFRSEEKPFQKLADS